MSRRRRGLTAGTGLVLGAAAAAATGNRWLTGVGLVLGVARRPR
jgi:hypothetical protein